MEKKLWVFNGDGLAGKSPVGVHRYLLQILKELDKLIAGKDLRIEVLIPKNKKINFKFNNISIVKIGIEKGNGIRKWVTRYIWRQHIFPSYLRKHKAVGIDVTLALPIKKCDFVYLHDCIVEAYPENYVSNKEKLYRRLYMYKVNRICKGEHKILTLSEESKKELIKYHNISPERISIVPCGWEHMIDIVPDYDLFRKYAQLGEENYFFALGSRLKHKNHKWILDVAKNNPQYYFVITGESFSSYNHNHLDLKNVIYTGYITDEQIKAFMIRCKALIQPSFYEGFGLPPLEALCLGKSIIISNSSCMPEIYGNSAHYIDPNNTDVNLEDLLNTPVSDGKEVLEQYTWKNAARKLLEIINEES
jgi:glycosyltransferase involved in cell wall biosynthesis